MTNTLPPPNGDHAKIEIVSIAPLVGEAIRRIHSGQSVGELFH